MRKPRNVGIEIEIKNLDLSEAQARELSRRLKSIILLVLPERLKVGQIRSGPKNTK